MAIQEQAAFEEWAKSKGFDMSMHPLHYIFLDEKTNAARDAWRAGMGFGARSMIESLPDYGKTGGSSSTIMPDRSAEAAHKRLDDFENTLSSLEHAVLRKGADRYKNQSSAQPMTFYDHAFIHAAVNHADYYSGSTVTQTVIDDAHAVAGMLTLNRANLI